MCKKFLYLELVWSTFFLHFPTFGLNTERYGVSFRNSVRMQENVGKIRTRITPNTDTFYAVIVSWLRNFKIIKSYRYVCSRVPKVAGKNSFEANDWCEDSVECVSGTFWCILEVLFTEEEITGAFLFRKYIWTPKNLQLVQANCIILLSLCPTNILTFLKRSWKLQKYYSVRSGQINLT